MQIMGGEGEVHGCGLWLLPEGCMAVLISLTGPRDACRLASVSKELRTTADSDAVWERFLPSDYPSILARSDVQNSLLLNSLSKKHLFLYLATRSLLIDSASKSFSLEASSSKKCFTIGARDLNITWAETPRYWTWYSAPDSRFLEVAELISVCWLEIQGKIKASMLSQDTNYGAYFVFKMADAAYGFHTPVELVIKTAGAKTQTRNACLDPQEEQHHRYHVVPRPRRVAVFNRVRTTVTRVQRSEGKGKVGAAYPTRRKDGWMEVEIGEFFNGRDEEGDVEMSVLEINGGHWKGGLIVEGIEIRPKTHNHLIKLEGK